MANIVFTTNPQNYSITNVAREAECSSFQPKETLPSLPQKPKAKLRKQSNVQDSDRQDVYSRVTGKIIADLEKGNLTCVKPWSVNPEISIKRPLRSDGTPYRGVNILVLWVAAAKKGYKCPTWLTYKKAQEYGGQVKRGEKGSLVVYTNTVTKSDIDDQGQETIAKIPFYKGYTVFNVEQVNGLPSTFYTAPAVVEDEKKRIEAVEQFIAKTKAVICHGSNEAAYDPFHDKIEMPEFKSFRDAVSYYAILTHELTHWTGHVSRLNRKFDSQNFGKSDCAMEEIVAEIGSAFLCADLGIAPETREDHAAYIKSWLDILKKDARAIFTAASRAQRAVDYLHGLTSSAES